MKNEYNTDRKLPLGGVYMQLLSVFLFSLSANIDGLTVGLAYGIKDIEISYKSNILIAIITSIGTFVSMTIGLFARKFIPIEILSIIGCIILILIGLSIIISSLKNKEERTKDIKNEDITYTEILKKPQKADKDNSGYIDTREAFTLGLALSLNNFGLGVGASATGINIYLTTIFTFILSILCIIIGVKIGRKYLSKSLRKYADLISGIVIIFLGLYELFI
nr:sporulation membrane protein YtaF [Gottschalkia acidurici]